MEDPTFWDDTDKAQATVAETNLIKGKLNPFLELEKRTANLNEVIEFAKESDDMDFAREANSDYFAIYL